MATRWTTILLFIGTTEEELEEMGGNGDDEGNYFFNLQ